MLSPEEYTTGSRVTEPGGSEFDVVGTVVTAEGYRFLVLADPTADVFGLSGLVRADVVAETWDSDDDQEAVQEKRQEEYRARADRQEAADQEPVTGVTDATGPQDTSPAPAPTPAPRA